MAWYAEHLGFEPVERFAFWAEGFDGGPLQISADGGATSLALFEVTDEHPMVTQQTGVAFSIDGDRFVTFARSLPGPIPNWGGVPLTVADLVDLDLYWAFDLADPWGNRYELNTYDYDHVRVELVERDGVSPHRYWPADRYGQWRARRPRRSARAAPA